MELRVETVLERCGRSIAVPGAAGVSCAAGRRLRLVVRHRGNPQGGIASRARGEGWTVLQAPLGVRARGVQELASVRAHPLEGAREPAAPSGAVSRVYSGTAVEVVLLAEDLEAPLVAPCFRAGVTLHGLSVKALAVPADAARGPWVDLERDAAVVAEAAVDPRAAERFLRWNRGEEGKAEPLEGGALSGLLHSSLVPDWEVLQGAGRCAPVVGLNLEGFPRPSATETLQARDPSGRLSRMAVAFGMGGDLWFFRDRRGRVVSKLSGVPITAKGVPLFWYNLAFDAAFTFKAFFLEARGHGCETELFQVRVGLSPTFSRSAPPQAEAWQDDRGVEVAATG
ncbi:MAG: hypothetical protein ACT4PV_09685, partial [Planctomycetaceae bacterium]